jgi:hypothetical protein
MSCIARLPVSGPGKQSRLFVGLVVSIALHGLVLATYFGQRADVPPSPQQQLTSMLTVTLQPSGIAEVVSPIDTVDDHQVGGMTARPTQPHQNRISRHTAQRQISDSDASSEKLDPPAKDHSSSPSPSIDIDAAREIARTLGRESAGASIQRAGPDALAMERETALGTSIAKAARPDCRTAQFNKSEVGGGFTFTATGLFAIPYLVKGAVTDGGCKW